MESQRRNRLMQLTGPVALALTLAILLMGQAQPADTTDRTEITAQSFVLVDSTGKECAWLKVDENNAPILLLQNGVVHASLKLSDASAGLACGNGKGVSWVGVTPRGPNVNFRGKDLKTGAYLGVGSDLGVGLHLYGESLNVGAALRVEPDGSPTLRLADKAGETAWKAP
jgi:hypothetical protein